MIFNNLINKYYKMTNYIRFIDNNCINILKKHNIKFSNILPKIIQDAVFNKDIRDDMYILCPVYQINENFINYNYDIDHIINKYSNLQIGITGSIKHGDSYYKTFVKELGEELGLQPIKGYKFNEYINFSKEKVKIVYIVNINKLLPVSESLELDIGIDNRNIKIGSIIYGTKTNILNFITIKNIILNKSNDKIIGVAAINVKFIREYISNLILKFKIYKKIPLLISKNGILVRNKMNDFNNNEFYKFDNYRNLIKFLDEILI
jgi:hypothetical protein